MEDWKEGRMEGGRLKGGVQSPILLTNGARFTFEKELTLIEDFGILCLL